MSRRFFEYGGWIAGAVLIVFGVVAIVMGVNGRSEVRDALAAQKITATPDAAEITNGKLQAGQSIDTGAEAKQFATIMEHHALEATQGQRYAEMGRFLTPSGEQTSDEAKAAKDPKTGQPVENGLRNLWVTETALATALNMSYMAEQLALFGVVVGVALLLTGIGFLVLSIGGALRKAEASEPTVAPKPVLTS
jgi:putative Mn2+ efflux pump MntP